MRSLALLGASGHGKVVADIALQAGWDSVVFFDDAWPRVSSNSHWAVLGDTSALVSRLAEFDGVIVAIGNGRIRWSKQQALQLAGARMATVVHPLACISRYTSIGAGSIVMPGTVVNVDTRIGDACIINTGSTVDHDCVLGHGVHISPGAHLSGNVTVGDCSWIGVGAAVRQGMTIGTGVMVGAGAVVVKPVADGLTVVGNPATPLNKI